MATICPELPDEDENRRELSPIQAEEGEQAEPLEGSHCDDTPESKEAAKEREAKNMRALQLKKFRHLLNKSKFYTEFLVNKMEHQQKLAEKAKNKEVNKKEKAFEPEKRKIATRGSKSKDFKNATIAGRKRTAKGSLKKAKEPKFAAELVEEAQQESEKTTSPGTKTKAKDEFSRTINGEAVSDRQPTWLTGGVLREYQLVGYEWLKLLFENGINGILADEMGLGKTIQCIALIAHLVEQCIMGPFLIIGPLSTLKNWVAEFNRFTPDIPVVLYHGEKSERSLLLKQLGTRVRVRGQLMYPVVVTSYELVIKDRKSLQRLTWKYIIVDEGHRIKNSECRLFKELKMYRSAHRLLLTGTPLQNNLQELWSLLNFLLPDVFDKLQMFESWFDIDSMGRDDDDEKIANREQEEKVLTILHEMLSPFLLRRLKTDVELNIPMKKELLVYAPLTDKQKVYYQHTMDRTILEFIGAKGDNEVKWDELSKDGILPSKRTRKEVHERDVLNKYLSDKEVFSEKEEAELTRRVKTRANIAATGKQLAKPLHKSYNCISLRNTVMHFRKICNHPYLISHPVDKNGEFIVNEELIHLSGKILVLEALLPKLRERGHKVLIFSQMTRLLDILQDYCDLRKHKYSILHGSMDLDERQINIDNFNNDPNIFLFLLSTRAGGLGLNLTAADTVIIYDSDWNPQCDLQAMDRCHRIGQTKPVMVYRLVTANTIDQRVIERAAGKRKLEKMVMHKDHFKNGRPEVKKEFTKKELLELLKSKDHEKVFKTGTTNRVFTEEELEMLLDRSNMSSNKTKEKTDHLFKVIEQTRDESDFHLLAPEEQ